MWPPSQAFFDKLLRKTPVETPKPEPIDYEALYPYWPYKVVERTKKSGRTVYQVERGHIQYSATGGVFWDDTYGVPGREGYQLYTEHTNQAAACAEAKELQLEYNDKVTASVRDVSCD